MIWQHGLDEPHKCLHHLNPLVDSIKFTFDYSRENINYLDTTVRLTNSTLYTDVYYKTIDSHSYLLHSLSNPRNCKNSMAYSQFFRIRCTSSSLSDFYKHAIEFSSFFTNRN